MKKLNIAFRIMIAYYTFIVLSLVITYITYGEIFEDYHLVLYIFGNLSTILTMYRFAELLNKKQITIDNAAKIIKLHRKMLYDMTSLSDWKHAGYSESEYNMIVKENENEQRD